MDADRPHPQQLNPAARTVAEVARLLGVAVEVVEKDVQEGTAVAADGNGRACAALGCSG
jgi:peptide subunit release factor 1 (eRF1)